MAKEKKPAPKRDYESPKLKVHGDLRKITKGSAVADRDDGGAAKSWDKGCP